MKLYDFVYITNNTSIIKYIKDTIILVENSIYSLNLLSKISVFINYIYIIYYYIIKLIMIEKNIFQSWYTKKLPLFLEKKINSFKKLNSDYTYYYQL